MRIFFLLAIVLSVSLSAQDRRVVMAQEAKAPTLTDLQKKDLQIAVQSVTILELQLQQAREALQKLVATVTPPGYQINERLELVPLKAPKDTP